MGQGKPGRVTPCGAYAPVNSAGPALGLARVRCQGLEPWCLPVTAAQRPGLWGRPRPRSHPGGTVIPTKNPHQSRRTMRRNNGGSAKPPSSLTHRNTPGGVTLRLTTMGEQKRTVPWEPLRPGALSQPLSGQSCWQWPTAGIAHVSAHPWRGGRGVRVVGGHRTRFTGPLPIVIPGLSAQPHGSTTTKTVTRINGRPSKYILQVRGVWRNRVALFCPYFDYVPESYSFRIGPHPLQVPAFDPRAHRLRGEFHPVGGAHVRLRFLG